MITILQETIIYTIYGNTNKNIIFAAVFRKNASILSTKKIIN
jgi:hypothetical protein